MSATGQEQEFRVLFAQEAEHRLARLDRDLLQLEKAGGDEELISSIFRDAHTLKGSAAVVALHDVTRVAHAMEDLLEQLRAGERSATPDLVDVLLAAADGLREMIPAVVSGDDRSAVADALQTRLEAVAARGASPAERPSVEASPDGIRRRDPDTLLVPLARLDKLVRLVGESEAARLRLGRMLAERLEIDPIKTAEFRDLSRALDELQQSAIRTRMVPIATITDSLQRAVRDLARSLDKNVRWEVTGADTQLDRSVLQQLGDPLLHLVRNAVDHGIETPAERVAAGKPEEAELALHATQLGSEVVISVTDDGRGIDIARIRERASRSRDDSAQMSDEDALQLVFESGISTARFISDVSGRGVGLDVVRAGVEAIRGRVDVHSELGAGTEFRIVAPITLAVLSCLVVGIGDERYALPMHSVMVAQPASAGPDAYGDGRPMVWVEDMPVAISSLDETLWGPGRGAKGDVAVVVGETRRHAFLVDRLLGQRNVVVKALSPLLPRSEIFAGASVEPDGSILLVLDVNGLVSRARRLRASGGDPGMATTTTRQAAPDLAAPDGGPQRQGTVMVVDDASIVRQLQRSILERAGYQVHTAVDGAEALECLATMPCDLVLTDIEMPRLDGFALTEAIRADARLANLPVLMITSRSREEDRQQGLAAGADGYVVKSEFTESALLDVVDRFLGPPV